MKPDQLLSDEEYLELLQLLDTHGTPEKVAEALDIPVAHVLKYLDTYRELKGFAGLAPPPTADEVVPMTPIIQSNPEAVERRLARIDDTLEPALVEMGLSPNVAKRMVLFRDYGRDRFTDIRQMVGGGTVVNLARLNAVTQGMFDRLDDPNTDKVERAMIVSQLDILLEHLHKTSDRAQQAALIEAKIKAANEGADRSKRSRKPGFRPLVAVNAGSVTITENAKPTAQAVDPDSRRTDGDQ